MIFESAGCRLCGRVVSGRDVKLVLQLLRGACARSGHQAKLVMQCKMVEVDVPKGLYPDA